MHRRDLMKSLASSPGVGSEARCECGQLVAKLRPDGVELKCKRCKRIVLIPFSTEERDESYRSVHL
jgi:phage FluMu protein Com